MTVIWSKIAVKQLLNIIQYIEENSFESYADTLEKDILTKISQLPSNHFHHPADRFKLENDGSYRAFEIDRYRISFRIINNEIRILQIRHTRRLPKQY